MSLNDSIWQTRQIAESLSAELMALRVFSPPPTLAFRVVGGGEFDLDSWLAERLPGESEGTRKLIKCCLSYFLHSESEEGREFRYTSEQTRWRPPPSPKESELKRRRPGRVGKVHNDANRALARQLRDQRMTYGEIAAALFDRGITSLSGRPVDASTIARLLGRTA